VLLEIPDGGVLVTAVTVSPHDLGDTPDDDRAREVLAAVGARHDGVLMEVVALLASMDPAGGPAAGVGIVRPLAYARPSAFPHADDRTDYDPDVRAAARQAATEDREMVGDLGGQPLVPLPEDLARIWSPMFTIGRAATVCLAARGAGQPR
jgi:hypothetical protein